MVDDYYGPLCAHQITTIICEQDSAEQARAAEDAIKGYLRRNGQNG